MNLAESSRPNAARDHLANERTFLAWVRTALGLIGLGFVLARMGLFLRQLAAAGLLSEGRRFHIQAGGEFLVSGVVFLVIGSLACALSARRYRINRKGIDCGTFDPAGASVGLLTMVVVGGGLIIAVMVVWRTLVSGSAL